MSPLIVILFFISDVILMFGIAKFMGVFFEKRRTPFLVMAFSYVFYLAVATVIRLPSFDWLDHMIFLPVLMRLLTLFIISLNYESSVLKKVVATVSYFVVFTIILYLCYFFVNLLPDSLLVYVNEHVIGPYMLASLLVYLIVHFFRHFKDIRKRDIPIPLFWVSALIVPGSTLAMAISTIAISSAPELELIFELSFMVFIIGANFLVIYIYDTLSAAYEDKINSALHSREKEYYLSQCQLMQESLEKMKSSRHDMKIHLAAIKDYIVENKRAVEYLNGLLGDIGESDIYSDTGNIAFDSIINFKLKSAKEDNIKPEVEVFVPSILDIEIVDIVTIIGNLLDNALDAVTRVEEKIIKLTIKFSKGNLFIKMDNTFDGRVKYTEDKAGVEKSISTLKDDNDHGYGLKNIRKSVEKYNGCVDIDHTDTIFSVGLLLYTDKRVV
ncbi:MAG: GHKL domain-containing protein [Peptococcaceae bacterium]|nr:GHKL domain-containing protein [Peptococcaceae bacterium]